MHIVYRLSHLSLGVHESGDAKVSEFAQAPLSEEHIERLDISVDDTDLVVNVLYSGDQLVEVPDHIIFLQRLRERADLLVEVTS